MIELPILPGISIQLIQALCAEHFGIPAEAMISPDRQRAFAWPRQIAMALCLEYLPRKSASLIGQHFGGRNHSTLLHGLAQAHRRAEKDPKVASAMRDLRLAIEAHRPKEVEAQP